MPRKSLTRIKCPTCKKPVKADGEDFPFCSQRCQLIDLGKWARGEYVISSPLQDISDAIRENQPDDPDKKL
jgi:uncharacterized protein